MDTRKLVDKLIYYYRIAVSFGGIGVLFFIAAICGGELSTLFFMLGSACCGVTIGIIYVYNDLKRPFPYLAWVIENKKIIDSKKEGAEA